MTDRSGAGGAPHTPCNTSGAPVHCRASSAEALGGHIVLGDVGQAASCHHRGRALRWRATRRARGELTLPGGSCPEAAARAEPTASPPGRRHASATQHCAAGSAGDTVLSGRGIPPTLSMAPIADATSAGVSADTAAAYSLLLNLPRASSCRPMSCTTPVCRRGGRRSQHAWQAHQGGCYCTPASPAQMASGAAATLRPTRTAATTQAARPAMAGDSLRGGARKQLAQPWRGTASVVVAASSSPSHGGGQPPWWWPPRRASGC